MTNCLFCGAPLPARLPGTRGRQRKYCSPLCSGRAQRLDGRKAAYAARYRAKNPWGAGLFFAGQECERCHADLARGEHVVCAGCARIRRREREAAKEGWLKQIERDPYTLAEIAARDRYRCQICVSLGRRRQARVDMALKVPHRKAPTIDHVIPRARGGDDTRTNVQLAHFGCNAWKRAGRPELDQQLLLVG